ncbi:secretory phospholipase A2 [Mytilus galloprovincialis]|uniref:Phospholipase A2 n=1 Tax=Mytilus galloprovincialis TaxID=29158 RepID=A0A8B6DL98_MYTGA|nr:secretory phospholipase A2 [Mytilus galloprovincialis]
MIFLRYMAACALFIIVISNPAERHEKRGTIQKKAWWNFTYQMLSIFGLGNSLFLFDYGCFCGYRGHGESVDTIDNCCQVHDACYTMIEEENKCWFHPKWTPYDYIISNVTGKNRVECKDEKDSCHWDVCMCEKIFVDCIHLHIEEYNDESLFLDTEEKCEER